MWFAWLYLLYMINRLDWDETWLVWKRIDAVALHTRQGSFGDDVIVNKPSRRRGKTRYPVDTDVSLG